jgi:hypothetical protein
LHFSAIETENDVQLNTPCIAPESDGWYRTFLKEPHGIIQVADRKIAVRAIATRGGLRDAIDPADLQARFTLPTRP